jgi:hypothetical protein
MAKSGDGAGSKVAGGAREAPLASTDDGAHVGAVSDLRRMYALMALRKPVRLTDGRMGVITRVDTSFPDNQTTLHVWIEGAGAPGLAKVRADEVEEVGSGAKIA